MRSSNRNWMTTLAAGAALAMLAGCAGHKASVSAHEPGKAMNVILFIGDGMGDNIVHATALTKQGPKLDAEGRPPRLSWERFPVLGLCSTYSSDAFVTDSAASATALATGHKSYNGAIGVDPDEKPLETIAEIAKARDMAVGVITSVQFNHATPSCFYAKAGKRSQYDDITRQAAAAKSCDVILGGDVKLDAMTADDVAKLTADNGKALYTLDSYASMTPQNAGGRQVIGYFAADKDGKLSVDGAEPSLADMTVKTLDLLKARNKRGFFLMCEGGAIDWMNHNNNFEGAIRETQEFDKAIAATVEWLEKNGELDRTLILVTADHETGGLTLPVGKAKLFDVGQPPPEPAWSTKGHSGAFVPVWGRGPGASRVAGKVDDTFIFDVMHDALPE